MIVLVTSATSGFDVSIAGRFLAFLAAGPADAAIPDGRAAKLGCYTALMTRVSLLVALAVSWAGCGSSNSTPPPTPTSVIGVWDLVSSDFTNGAHAPVKGVLSFRLAADGTTALDSCLSPGYSGTTLTCSQQRVCASGTYTFDGTTLTIQQTGQTTTHGGPATFGPGSMSISGPNVVGASVSSSTFNVIGTLPTDCASI